MIHLWMITLFFTLVTENPGYCSEVSQEKDESDQRKFFLIKNPDIKSLVHFDEFSSKCIEEEKNTNIIEKIINDHLDASNFSGNRQELIAADEQLKNIVTKYLCLMNKVAHYSQLAQEIIDAHRPGQGKQPKYFSQWKLNEEFVESLFMEWENKKIMVLNYLFEAYPDLTNN
jgi:hypothetical protein